MITFQTELVNVKNICCRIESSEYAALELNKEKLDDLPLADRVTEITIL